MSDQPASDEQITVAREFGAHVPENPTHFQCMQAMFTHALQEQRPIIITMGTAWDEDMEEKPWRARVDVQGFQNSPQGLRARCDTEPVERYLIGNAQQGPGRRLFLLSEIDSAEPAA